MEETFKFPGSGYDVHVVRKQDVLDCIEDNIIDKEIALEVVKRCEIDAISFLKEGRWAGIPFIGNIRIPKTIAMLNSKPQQDLIKEAASKYTKEEYVLFRRELCANNEKIVRFERTFNYTVSVLMNRHPNYYAKLRANKGLRAAKIMLYSLSKLNVVNEAHITEYYNYYGQI